jgi:PPOX class probable F420-dependent enzyme
MQMRQEQCRARFAAARVLRLATADVSGGPHLVAATFAVVGDRVVTAVDHKPKRHERLRRLRNIQQNPSVAALVDHYDDDWDRLWWVRADGEARVLPNENARPLVDALADKYPQYRQARPTGPVIEIVVHRWSGWLATPGGP